MTKNIVSIFIRKLVKIIILKIEFCALNDRLNYFLKTTYYEL